MSNVRALPTRVSGEPWLDRKQMSAHFGVSLATLDRMVGAGMPSTRFGKARRFKASVAEQWLAANGPARRSWRDAA